MKVRKRMKHPFTDPNQKSIYPRIFSLSLNEVHPSVFTQDPSNWKCQKLPWARKALQKSGGGGGESVEIFQ